MKFRTLLLGLSALFIAVAAAYFSITGLSKLFAGASTAVILMASSLEFGKLISASFLYIYWDNVNKVLRTYLLIGVCVLILITSAGIYGFLTSAYQTTADQLSIITKQTEVIELKKKRFQEQLDGYNKEKASLNQSISDLSKGLSNNVFQVQGAEGQILTTTSSANRKVLDKQLNDSKTQRDIVSKRIEALSDSVTKLDLSVIDLNVNNDLAAEVGPLKFMAEITGRPMATIVNWFALFIVFVFDPLAVTLVIAFNTAMRIDNGSNPKDTTPLPKEYKVYGDKEDNKKPKLAPKKDLDIDTNELSDITPPYINRNYKKIDNKEINESDDDFSDLDILDFPFDEPAPTIEEPIRDESKENKLDLNDPDILALKRDTSKRAIDVDGDGNIDGYDFNGDGLIDRYTFAGSTFEKDKRLPYYARPEFDWNDKAKWINDQNAVNYWLTHKKI